MAALCVASEVAVSLSAESSITDHVAPPHHRVQVWEHTLNLDCASFDLILAASPGAVRSAPQGWINALIHIQR